MADDRLGTVQTTQLEASLWVLRLVGEHDLSTAPLVEAAFEPIEASGTTVVVDLTETSFIDFQHHERTHGASATRRDTASRSATHGCRPKDARPRRHPRSA